MTDGERPENLKTGKDTSAVSDPKTADKPPDTQSSSRFSKYFPAWFQEFPHFFRLPPPKEKYRFISEDKLTALLADFNEETKKRIRDDLTFMDYELMRLFRERDREAAFNQNRYRSYQILYIVLATLAGTFGGLQALYLSTNTTLVSLLAFIETLIALVATFLAAISSREPPLPLWLDNRRRAEHMRREFFRYLLNLPPYDKLVGARRKRELSRRAADINRGVYPDEIDT
jgi:hypothetical protein